MEKPLTSWKEIAAYLNKSVRTMQRWEREFGLPIHRPSGHVHGIVIALGTELDDWFRTYLAVAQTKHHEVCTVKGARSGAQ